MTYFTDSLASKEKRLTHHNLLFPYLFAFFLVSVLCMYFPHVLGFNFRTRNKKEKFSNADFLSRQMLLFWRAGVAQSSYLIFFLFDRVSDLDITEEKLCRWEVKIWIKRNNQRRRKKQTREKKFERERMAMSKGERRNKWKYWERKN